MAPTQFNMAYTDLTMVCIDGKVDTFKAIDGFAEGIKGAIEIGDKINVPFTSLAVQSVMDMIHNPTTTLTISDPALFNEIVLAADYLGLLRCVINTMQLAITTATAPGFLRASMDNLRMDTLWMQAVVLNCFRAHTTPDEIQKFYVVSVLDVIEVGSFQQIVIKSL